MQYEFYESDSVISFKVLDLGGIHFDNIVRIFGFFITNKHNYKFVYKDVRFQINKSLREVNPTVTKFIFSPGRSTIKSKKVKMHLISTGKEDYKTDLTE